MCLQRKSLDARVSPRDAQEVVCVYDRVCDCLYMKVCVCVSVCLSVYLSIRLSVYEYVHQHIRLHPMHAHGTNCQTNSPAALALVCFVCYGGH